MKPREGESAREEMQKENERIRRIMVLRNGVIELDSEDCQIITPLGIVNSEAGEAKKSKTDHIFSFSFICPAEAMGTYLYYKVTLTCDTLPI